MALETRQGTGGAVRLRDASNAMETIANLRSWSVEESVDTVEDTSMASGFRSYKTTHKTWTATADVYITYDTASASAEVEGFTTTVIASSNVDAISVGDSYDWEFYANDADSFGHESYNGLGIVTGISRSVAHDGMAEMSVTIQGNSLLS